MSTPAQLSVDVVARMDKWESAMNALGRSGSAAVASIQSKLQMMSSVITGVGGLLATALGGAALTSVARQAIDSIDALNDLKDSTGASIENLSALEDAAMRTGTSMETVGAAILRMNKFLAEAEPGSAQAKMLKTLGLEAEELRRIDPALALHQIALAFSNFEDNGNKARFMTEMLGKGVKELAPLMFDLADKTNLMPTVTKETAEQVDKLNKQIAQMEKNSLDAKRAIAAELLPALNQFIERMRGISAGGGFFASIGKELKANMLSDQLRVAVGDLETVQKKIDQAGGKDGMHPMLFSWLDRRRGLLRTEIADMQRELLQLSGDIKGFADIAKPLGQGRRPANEGGGKILFTNSLPDLPPKKDEREKKEVDPAAKAYETLIAKMRQRDELAQVELKTGEKASEGEKHRIEVLAELAKAVKLDTDPARAARMGAEIEKILKGNVATLDAVEAQRELREALKGTTRLQEQGLAQLTAEADSRMQTVEALRLEAEAYGLTEQQVEALNDRRLQQLLVDERAALAMAQNAAMTREQVDAMHGLPGVTDEQIRAMLRSVDASEQDAQQRERLVRFLEQELALRQGLAARRERDATDPMAGARRAVNDYGAEVEKAGDKTYSLVRSGIDGLEDRLTDFFSKGKADWKGYFQWIAMESMRMRVVQPAINGLLNAGINLLSGMSGGGYSYNGGVGTSNAAGISGGRAYGGPVGARELRPFGERGLPEVLETSRGAYLWTGDAGGQVTALRPTRAGGSAPDGAGGGRSIVFAPRTEIRVDARADAAQVRREVEGAIADSERRQLERFRSMGIVR